MIIDAEHTRARMSNVAIVKKPCDTCALKARIRFLEAQVAQLMDSTRNQQLSVKWEGSGPLSITYNEQYNY